MLDLILNRTGPIFMISQLNWSMNKLMNDRDIRDVQTFKQIWLAKYQFQNNTKIRIRILRVEFWFGYRVRKLLLLRPDEY